MIAPSQAERLLAPAERLAAALTDPARRERTAVLALIAYAALWAIYGTVAKSAQDIHFDMAETYVWAREIALGYPKHPPLAAWLAAAWFAVFPATDWAYYLLAAATPALGLWIAWRLSADYLDADKRVIGLGLLTLVPFYNFHALKYNVNTVLIPLWAATALFFLRSFATHNLIYAALAGLAAAAAMLGKYWSIFLLAGLALAALTDARRGGYFRSAAPWVTAAVGAAALAPHVFWLNANGWPPFSYALAAHGAQPLAAAVTAVAGYLAGLLGYLAVPLLLAFAAVRPTRAACADTLLPPQPDRRLAAAAFWGPLLLPPAAALVTGVQIGSLWTMSALTLLPVVLLSSPLLGVPRRAVVAIVAIAVALPVICAAASPLVASIIHRAGPPDISAHARPLAQRIAQEWRSMTDRPLRLIAGSSEFLYGIAFYLPSHPSAFPDFDRRTAPWFDPARIERDGVAVVCKRDDSGCLAQAHSYAGRNPASRRLEVDIARSHFGSVGRPARYVLTVIPPR